jgi:hypothetical protein
MLLRILRSGRVTAPGAVWAVLLTLFLWTSQAQAETLSFALGTTYSADSVPPANAPPWLTATFDDHGTSGTVTLEIEPKNLSITEFIGACYFNLDSAMDPNLLQFGALQKTGSFADPTILHVAQDSYKADGDGKYDILFAFAENEQARFNGGDKLRVDITGIGLWASSFDLLSKPAGGNGPFTVAAHLQGIVVPGEPNGSAWIATPEPSTLVPLIVGVLGLGSYGWWWRRS